MASITSILNLFHELASAQFPICVVRLFILLEILVESALESLINGFHLSSNNCFLYYRITFAFIMLSFVNKDLLTSAPLIFFILFPFMADYVLYTGDYYLYCVVVNLY